MGNLYGQAVWDFPMYIRSAVTAVLPWECCWHRIMVVHCMCLDVQCCQWHRQLIPCEVLRLHAEASSLEGMECLDGTIFNCIPLAFLKVVLVTHINYKDLDGFRTKWWSVSSEHIAIESICKTFQPWRSLSVTKLKCGELDGLKYSRLWHDGGNVKYWWQVMNNVMI